MTLDLKLLPWWFGCLVLFGWLNGPLLCSLLLVNILVSRNFNTRHSPLRVVVVALNRLGLERFRLFVLNGRLMIIVVRSMKRALVLMSLRVNRGRGLV